MTFFLQHLIFFKQPLVYHLDPGLIFFFFENQSQTGLFYFIFNLNLIFANFIDQCLYKQTNRMLRAKRESGLPKKWGAPHDWWHPLTSEYHG